MREHATFDVRLVGWWLLGLLGLVLCFLLDELLRWLGWQVWQTPLLTPSIGIVGLLLGSVVGWWYMAHDTAWLDWLDWSGTVIGCVIGGALLACYTIFPPAGVVTLIIFALCVVYVMLAEHPQHTLMLGVMILAFVGTSLFVNQWRHGEDVLLATAIEENRVYHIVEHAVDEQALNAAQLSTGTLYACNRLGMDCAVHSQVTLGGSSAAFLAPALLPPLDE